MQYTNEGTIPTYKMVVSKGKGGAQAAARKKAWVRREEERIHKERRAFWPANARGVSRGQIVRN